MVVWRHSVSKPSTMQSPSAPLLTTLYLAAKRVLCLIYVGAEGNALVPQYSHTFQG